MPETTQPRLSEANLATALRAWISDNLFNGASPAGFDESTDLIAGGIMDSLAIMRLVTYLESEHGVKIEAGDIVPEHFLSINAIAAFIRGKLTTPDAAPNQESLEERGRELIAKLPHLTAYPAADYVLAPYINCSLRPHMDTGIIRTDAYGYRVSHDPHGIVDSQSWFERPRRALVLGNSFTVGWCCSGDRTTLPSYLNHTTPYSCLNLGIVGASSLQETIASIPFLQHADLVLIVSGVGNLMHYFEYGREYDLYGAFYPQQLFLGTRQTRIDHLGALLHHAMDDHKSGVADQVSETLRRTMLAHDKRPPAWQAEEIQARVDLAVQHHRRDLRLLVRAVQPNTPILYAMQPSASLAKPELLADEQAMLAAFRQFPMWKDVFEPYVMDQLPDYIKKIAQNCAELGVPFIDLNTLDYQGVCFVDYGHVTDAANEQIAHYLAKQIPS